MRPWGWATRRRSPVGDREAGMVTAEFAAALPAVLLVVALALTVVRVGIDEIRCVDAARVAARSAARGDPEPDVRARAAQTAPRGAGIDVARDGTDVIVTVTPAPVADLPLIGPLHVPAARAVAAAEGAP